MRRGFQAFWIAGESRSTRSYPFVSRIRTEKRAWDMPTSQSNSVLETWTHAAIVTDLSADETDYFRVADNPGTIRSPTTGG